MHTAFFLGMTAIPFGQMPDGTNLDIAPTDQQADAFLNMFTVLGADQNLGSASAIAVALPLPTVIWALPTEPNAPGLAVSIAELSDPEGTVASLAPEQNATDPFVASPTDAGPSVTGPSVTGTPITNATLTGHTLGELAGVEPEGPVIISIEPTFVGSISGTMRGTPMPDLSFNDPTVSLHLSEALSAVEPRARRVMPPSFSHPGSDRPLSDQPVPSQPTMVPEVATNLVPKQHRAIVPTKAETIAEQPILNSRFDPPQAASPEAADPPAGFTDIAVIKPAPASGLVTKTTQPLPQQFLSTDREGGDWGQKLADVQLSKPTTDGAGLDLAPEAKTDSASKPVLSVSNRDMSAFNDHPPRLNAHVQAEVSVGTAFTTAKAQVPMANSAGDKQDALSTVQQSFPPGSATPFRQVPNHFGVDRSMLPIPPILTTFESRVVSVEAPSDTWTQAKSAAPTPHMPDDIISQPTETHPDITSANVRKVDAAVPTSASTVTNEVLLMSEEVPVVFQPTETSAKEATQYPPTIENAFQLRLAPANGPAVPPASSPATEEANTHTLIIADTFALPLRNSLTETEARPNQIARPSTPHPEQSLQHDDPVKTAEILPLAGFEGATERPGEKINADPRLATNTIAANHVLNPVNAPSPTAVPLSLEHATSVPFDAPSPVRQTAAILANQSPSQPGTIEFTLTPETLGRLHFEMQPEGDAMAITLSAERPETLDLMRRHLSDLVSELKQAGIQAGTLSFGTWTEGRNAPPPPPPPPDEAAKFDVTPNRSNPTSTRPALAAAGGLDLRI